MDLPRGIGRSGFLFEVAELERLEMALAANYMDGSRPKAEGAGGTVDASTSLGGSFEGSSSASSSSLVLVTEQKSSASLLEKPLPSKDAFQALDDCEFAP